MKKMFFMSICAFLNSLLVATETFTPAGKWETLGPAVFGACFAPSFNPHVRGEMIYGTDMGGAFLSRDFGKSWQILGSQSRGGNPGYRGTWRSCFDPQVKNRIWIVSEHGVFRSDDSGVHWKRMTQDGTPRGYYLLSFAPGNSNILYTGEGFVAPKGWQYGALWRSADAGQTWQPLNSPDTSKGSGFTALEVLPGEKKLILCGHRGIWESVDKGQHWSSILTRFPFPNGAKPRFTSLYCCNEKIFAMVIPFRVGNKVYGGLWVSSDEGKSWQESTFNQYAEKMMNRSFHGPVCGYLIAGAKSSIYVAIHGFGVSRSDDGGITWRQTLKSGQFWYKMNDSYFPSAKAGSNIKGGTVYSTDAVRGLAVNPADPDMVMFTDNDTATMSFDGGKSWSDAAMEYVYPFDKGRFGAEVPTQLSWAVRSRGPQMIVCNKMGRDSHNPKILYAAYQDHGLHVSRDGGSSWERPSRGLEVYRDICSAKSFTVDPKHPGRVYFTSSLPVGRAFVSDDYGVSFRNISLPPHTGQINKESHSGIVIAPADSNHLFMTTDAGLWESRNGGAKWVDITPVAIREYPKCRWLVINRNGFFLAPETKRGKGKGGLFHSADGGKSWQHIMPEQIGNIVSIQFSNKNPEIGYLIAHKPGESGSIWFPRTLYKTTDGGFSWKAIQPPALFSGLAVHPENPEILYTTCYVQNLNSGSPEYLRSRDGGKSWQVISRDIPIVGIMNNILINPANPKEVFFCDYFTVYRLLSKI